jgi:dihydrofolate reductase
MMARMGNVSRTLSVELFSTVDGYASGTRAEGYFGLYGPELAAWIDEQLARPHVMVMGRKTYAQMAEIVATQEDRSFARMTELPKLVFSSTLTEPLPWANSTLVRENVRTAMPRLKAEPGDPLRVIGSLALLHSLLPLGLVDRLRLILFPQVLAETGTAPIFAGLPDLALELEETRLLDGRLVVIDYRPRVADASPEG